MFEKKDVLNTTRWTPTSCKWGYKSYKWPSKWVTGVTTPTRSGIRTPFIFGRGCYLKVQQHRMIDDFLVLESPLSPVSCICYELELEILKKHGSTNCLCFVASVEVKLYSQAFGLEEIKSG